MRTGGSQRPQNAGLGRCLFRKCLGSVLRLLQLALDSGGHLDEPLARLAAGQDASRTCLGRLPPISTSPLASLARATTSAGSATPAAAATAGSTTPDAVPDASAAAAPVSGPVVGAPGSDLPRAPGADLASGDGELLPAARTEEARPEEPRPEEARPGERGEGGPEVEPIGASAGRAAEPSALSPMGPPGGCRPSPGELGAAAGRPFPSAERRSFLAFSSSYVLR